MFQILLHFVILLENMSPTLSVTPDLTNAFKKKTKQAGLIIPPLVLLISKVPPPKGLILG